MEETSFFRIITQEFDGRVANRVIRPNTFFGKSQAPAINRPRSRYPAKNHVPTSSGVGTIFKGQNKKGAQKPLKKARWLLYYK